MNSSSICSTNFVFCVQTLRIFILTFNRPQSLQRMLHSLEMADYKFKRNNPGWKLMLEIHVDGGGGLEGQRVKEVASQFEFSYGSKIVIERENNIGVMEAWKNAWSWEDNELFVVIEDDVEMSPHWFRALSNFWLKYGGREDLAGVGLHLQEYVVPSASSDTKKTGVPDGVYMYQLPASIASSPHPFHWAEMIRQHGDKFGTCPVGMDCSADVWEAWWLQYGMENTLFTLYLGGTRAMAVDHREKGLHATGQLGKLSEAVEGWDDRWEVQLLPDVVPRRDLAMVEISDLKYFGMKMAKKFGMAIILIVDENNIDDIVKMHNEENEDQQLRDNLKKTILVLPSSKQLPHMQLLPNVARVHGHVFINTSQPQVEPSTSHQLHLWAEILATLTQIRLRIVTLPAPDLLRYPVSFPQVPGHMYHIMAGRRGGQTSPSIDYLWLDAEYQVFRMFVEMVGMVRRGEMEDSLVVYLRYFMGEEHGVRWAWTRCGV